jgi:hypothetical protein
MYMWYVYVGIGIRQVRQHVQALCNASYIDKLLDVVQSAPNEPGGAGKYRIFLNHLPTVPDLPQPSSYSTRSSSTIFLQYPIFPPASLSACVKINRH